MATDTNTHTLTRWEPRPAVAALLRAFVLIAPIAASVAFVHFAGQIIGPPSGSALGHVAWWVGLSAGATGVLIGIDRLTRRLLPLAALLKLALVFPDEAPSRFRTALRAGTTAELEGRVERARASGDAGTPVEAAERLLGFVAALNTHDRVTRGHSERVRAYAQMIAKELHLGRDEVDRLNWAALLHDIGKLEVPAEVLNKPGQPTVDEWRLIRRHPELGARMAEPLRTWLGEWTTPSPTTTSAGTAAATPTAAQARTSRWPAASWPSPTSSTSSPPRAPTRTPRNAITAREEIARCAGDQFDPRVVRAFLSISLGRLRLAMGPLSWLAQAPVLGRIPLAPGMATVASSAVAVSARSPPGSWRDRTCRRSSRLPRRPRRHRPSPPHRAAGSRAAGAAPGAGGLARCARDWRVSSDALPWRRPPHPASAPAAHPGAAPAAPRPLRAIRRRPISCPPIRRPRLRRPTIRRPRAPPVDIPPVVAPPVVAPPAPPVNHAPSFSAGGDQAVAGGRGRRRASPRWAHAISRRAGRRRGPGGLLRRVQRQSVALHSGRPAGGRGRRHAHLHARGRRLGRRDRERPRRRRRRVIR